MTERHAGGHDPLLEELSAGRLDAAGPELERRLADCPACRAEWAEHLETARALEALATEEGEELALAQQLRDAPGEEEVERLVRAELAPRGGDASIRSTRRGLLVAAAAAAVVSATLLLRRGGEREERDLLGVDEIDSLHPDGAASNYRSFQWRGELSTGSRFLFQVWNDADLSSPDPLFAQLTSSPSVTLDEETTRAWPGEIRWEVVIVKDDGSTRSAGEAVTWRP